MFLYPMFYHRGHFFVTGRYMYILKNAQCHTPKVAPCVYSTNNNPLVVILVIIFNAICHTASHNINGVIHNCHTQTATSRIHWCDSLTPLVYYRVIHLHTVAERLSVV